MTREEAEKEVEKLGLTGQAKAQKINELMGKEASNFEGGTAKENPKKTLKEKLVATPEDLQNMTKDREDVKGSIRRSEIANPAVNVVDRITGNVTGLNEDLFDPTAIKAKDLDETGNLKAKDFHLGDGIEGNFIGAEEGDVAKNASLQSVTSGGNSGSAGNGTSANISNFDKNYLDTQSGRADYIAETELEKQREGEKKRYDDLMKDFELSRKGFKSVDDHLVENIPTFALQRYKNGEFGEPGSKDAKLRLAHFMISGLQSTLKTASNAFAANAGRAPVFADTTSDYEKYQQTNLAKGLENRWRKNEAETESAVEALKKQNMEEQDIRNSINKIATNAKMQTAFNMMNEEQKIHAIKVISEVGDKIKNFNNEDLTTFLTGAMLSDKDFSNEDLLTAVGLKYGTEFLNSDTAKDIVEKVKLLAGK